MFISHIHLSNDFVQVTPNDTPRQSGSLYWNKDLGKLSIFDGITRDNVYINQPQNSLTAINERALAWARNKMIEEEQLDELCKKHEGLKSAREQFELMKAMCTSNTDISK